MFSFFHKEIKTANFEDIKWCIDNKNKNTYLINTLKNDEQICLICNTVSCVDEEIIINEIIKNNDQNETIIIVYGKNTNDTSVEKKYNQLKKLGFEKVYIYKGGMFEWLLLQDIYGFDEFQTNTKIIDILKYKPGNSIIKY